MYFVLVIACLLLACHFCCCVFGVNLAYLFRLTSHFCIHSYMWNAPCMFSYSPVLTCLSNPCMHGGSCAELEQDLGYSCTCLEGFSGINCETQGTKSEWIAHQAHILNFHARTHSHALTSSRTPTYIF